MEELLLSGSGRLLAATLDLDETLRGVASLPVPALADRCVVELRRPDGSVQRVGDPPEAGEAALAVPLRAGERELGTLTLVARGHSYTPEDHAAAAELAERGAQALVTAQAFAEAQAAHAMLATLVATAPVGIALLDPELRFVLVNPRMAAMNGRDAEAHLGHTLPELFGPDGDEVVALMREVLDTGVPVTDVEIVAGPDDRSFLVSYAPALADERPVGVVAAVVETTERRRREQALLDRAQRLQDVSEHLAEALTAAEVAEVTVREGMAATGACCGILAVPDEQAGVLRFAHRFGLAGDAPPGLPLDAPAPMPLAVRERLPVLLGSREAWLRRFPQVPPRGPFSSFAALPLLFEGEARGCMGLGFAEERDFDADTVELLLAIARQGAQALERARLHDERTWVARTLQEGLLPRMLPDVPGVELAVRYRPVGDGSEVGGDFYDVVEVEDGEHLLVVGDVCGKGAAAATLTGFVRATIRAVALDDASPGHVLERVNRALLAHDAPGALATVACGVLRRTDEGATVRLVTAGHPPALVLRAGGEVETVATHGRLLGAVRDARLDEAEVRLGRGDVLLLYTDGVIDARVGRGTFGETRLRDAVAAARGGSAAAVVDAVDAAVRAASPGARRDDEALLALRIP
jgi:PAS domain S-box-containing protein